MGETSNTRGDDDGVKAYLLAAGWESVTEAEKLDAGDFEWTAYPDKWREVMEQSLHGLAACGFSVHGVLSGEDDYGWILRTENNVLVEDSFARVEGSYLDRLQEEAAAWGALVVLADQDDSVIAAALRNIIAGGRTASDAS